MTESKTYTIHKSKKSLVDRFMDARESLRRTLEDTSHRLEIVDELKGVEFLNDARSSDLLSTRDSFKCLQKPIIWIAATTTHDRDYALIEKYVKLKIKGIVVYGTNGDDMMRKLEGLVESFAAGRSLEDAVQLAYKQAQDGDVVIFSPSCVPNDDFRNFVDRGVAYVQYVNKLEPIK
jgi:UDP-N-acetylmuramoylalanine--D-glutamate ligase